MIGVDLVYLPEFTKNLEDGGEPFLSRVYLPSELANRKTEHLAGIFAAKEAIIKALSLPIGSWQEIEVISTGRPRALVSRLNGLDQDEKVIIPAVPVDISISHHGDYAIAVATQTNDK